MSDKNSSQNKRYYIDDKVYLTKKEVECLYWLAMGKSSSEISMILGNSERTIESHLAKCKAKMNCYKATTLVLKARDLGFI